MAWGLLLFAAIVVLGLLLAGVESARAQECAQVLRSLADLLEDGKAEGRAGWIEGVAIKVRGRFQSFPCKASLRTYFQQQRFLVVEFEIATAVGYFEVEASTLAKRLERWFEGSKQHVEEPDVDRRFLFRGNLKKLKNLVAEEQVVLALEGLFSGGVQDVQLINRKLVVRIEESRAGELRLLDLLEKLAVIAKLCERQPVTVMVSEKLQFAWTGGTDGALCPYCRDQLSLESDALASCERCQTLHHELCGRELTCCTIYGCQGLVKSLRN